MYYLHKTTKQFGITLQDACRAACVSAPAGCLEIGDFQGYVITEPPITTRWQTVREVAPVKIKGVLSQAWEVVESPLTGAERAAIVAREQIVGLEATVTPRRIREAVLGIDGGWLAGVDAQIAALRGQL